MKIKIIEGIFEGEEGDYIKDIGDKVIVGLKIEMALDTTCKCDDMFCEHYWQNKENAPFEKIIKIKILKKYTNLVIDVNDLELNLE